MAIRDDEIPRALERFPTEAELQAIATELAAAEALANSEKRFRLAFENSMDGMMCVDPGDRVLAVNDSFCQIVGRSREELVDKGAAPFTHPKEVVRPDVSKADQVRYLDHYLRPGGRRIDVEVSKSSVRNPSGATAYSVISVRDVTEEQALRARSPTRRCATRSLGSPTGRCSRTGWPRRTRGPLARAGGARRCCWTSTTSRR